MKKFYLYTLNSKKLALSLIFALCLSAGVVHATVYTVNNTADGSATNQLRGALVAASSTAGSHTVNIVAGTFYIDLGEITMGAVSNCIITINGAGVGNTIIDARKTSRGFRINQTYTAINLEITFKDLTIENCRSTANDGGGAIQFVGGPGDKLFLINCKFQDNIATTSSLAVNGGAVVVANVSLVVDNCTFFNNDVFLGSGGAIRFEFAMGAKGIAYGEYSITNSSFSFNTIFNPFGGGGAISVYLLGSGGSFSGSISECTFATNTASEGRGGAVSIASDLATATLSMNYNRFAGNVGKTELPESSAVFFAGTTASVDARNNWWGCNEGATGCADRGLSLSGGNSQFAPHLQLKTTLSEKIICAAAGPSQVTAGFTYNSDDEWIDASNLGALVGRSISFVTSGSVGNLSGAQTTIQSSGTATVNFNPNGSAGTAGIYAISEVSSPPVSLTVVTPGSWIGNTSSDWYTPANWCGTIPTATTDILIPAGTLHTPIIPSVVDAATAKNITIETGASLDLYSYATLDVKGNFTNNGTFSPNAEGVLIAFSGAGDQTVPGASYQILSIGGGGTKTLTGDASLNSQFIFSGNSKMALGNNSLALNTNAIVQSAGVTRYFITNGTGGLKKKDLGASVFTFPIGSETSYSPVVLSNSGTPDNFTARVGDGVYQSYVNNVPQGSAVSQKAVNKTWYIGEDVPGESNVGLTLYWDQASELPSFDRTNCFVSHYESSGWNPTSAAGASASGGLYFRGRSGISSFSPFGIANPNSPLPVTLVRFDAMREGSTALLNWSTTEETNSDRFEIERSINGKIWQIIGTVRANGESKSLANYHFTDKFPSQSQENLYRLKMIDRSTGTAERFGTFAYSSIRSVKFDGIDNPAVYPNPVSDKLFVQDFTRVSSLRITEAGGKVVYQSGTLKHDGISVNKLAAGIHLVEVNWLDGRKVTQKIIINQ